MIDNACNVPTLAYIRTLDSVDYFILFRSNHFVIRQRGVLRVLGRPCANLKKNGQKVAINFYGSHLLRPTAVIILYHLNIYI